MKIRQQKDIKKFLEGEFSPCVASEIYGKQSDLLFEMLNKLKEPDKSRHKTLAQTILPRIALYKVLQESLPETETVSAQEWK